MTRRSVAYGTVTIEYELHYADRKTLGITVRPDQRVIVSAPPGTGVSEVEARLRKRGAWILRQQREFEDYLPVLPPRRYVGGESHLYLGRRYRLKIVAGDEEGVKLAAGRFFITVRDRDDAARIKTLLDGWYRRRAAAIFAERLAVCHAKARPELPFPELRIRVMEKRWGSCTTGEVMLLNLKLIQTPKFCIDYVITHELAHLKEHHHGPAYYALLDRLMPDWQERRRRLHEFQVA
ncbi:MAG: M48 family metallopeptidase [Candidatus Promineofilum sp.]|uniref:M48 family metallopeptidase n=1 Tax=Promineifilum sp. TaxID=2664178 RepID=UPI002411D6A9|nr:M48 family metallopeptidase [Promineifilum sp.]